MEEKQNRGSRLIVFEGISGAGKSTLISELSKLPYFTDCLITNWFSLNTYRTLASEISQYQEMTAELYSLIYALEFYARHELQIEPSYNKGINILAHRYIFTPMTHDTVRGTKKEFLDYLYGKKVIEPDIVFFLDVKPELAYKRIIMYRKPSFFECGLDIEYSKHISIGLKRYAENYFSDNELKERFLDFQHQIYLNYKEVLPSYATVFVNGVNSISEQKNLIVQKLQDSFKGLQN